MSLRTAKKISSFTQQEIARLRKTAKHMYAAQGIRILAASSFSESSRILIVIPGTSGNAVKRNLIRRRIKAIFHQENFSTTQHDYVVIVKKAGIHASYETIRELLLTVKTLLANQHPVKLSTPS